MPRVNFAKLVEVTTEVLVGHGYSAENARLLANNCVTAQRDGSESHGLFRLKDYISSIDSGYVNGLSAPRIEVVASGFITADADNGFAQIALARSKAILMERARQNGIAVLAIRNSHHTGALYLDVEPFAEEGFIALAVVNSIAVVAPPDGLRGVYGTNPIAFAAPRDSGPCLVFDFATSSMSHGDLQIAASEGRAVGADTGIDAYGRRTADPSEILHGGALLPFGGHKGAAISLMIEILCAGLVGASFSFEVGRDKPEGATTARTGETIVLIHPIATKQLGSRIDELVAALKDAGQSRIPGERHAISREKLGDTVDVSESILASLYLLGGQ